MLERLESIGEDAPLLSNVECSNATSSRDDNALVGTALDGAALHRGEGE